MEIRIKSVGFSASSQLEAYIGKKFEKLSKYNDAVTVLDVVLKLEKDDKLENKVVEVGADAKGQTIFAKKNAKTFEGAVDELCDVVKRQFVKAKEKSVE